MKPKKHIHEPGDLGQGNWHPENWDELTLYWLKTEDGKATLALLQAAPDLLEALKQAVADAAPASNPVSRMLNYKQALAAIAKAEGRSS